MHELSIAYSLVETASEAARQAGAREVRVVNLRLGALSGVVEEALRFAFDLATEDTPLAGSRLVVEPVPARVACAACGRESPLASVQWVRCPACGSAAVRLTQGREIELVSLEAEE